VRERNAIGVLIAYSRNAFINMVLQVFAVFSISHKKCCFTTIFMAFHRKAYSVNWGVSQFNDGLVTALQQQPQSAVLQTNGLFARKNLWL
jgi:hypothetical protein